MDITISVPEQLAEQLQYYADKHQTSVNELTTDYWQAIIEENYIDSEHQKEVRERVRAYRAGEVEAIPLEEFKQKMNLHTSQ